MASETYEFLKKIANGEEINRWSYPDDLIYNIEYKSNKNPIVIISFEDDDDFFDVFDLNDDDRWAFRRFVSSNYYNDEYDSWRYKEDWREGYILRGFNEENIEKVSKILKLTNPTLRLEGDNDYKVSQFLESRFSDDVSDLTYEYGTRQQDCIGRAVAEIITSEVKNPFDRFGILEVSPHYKFKTSAKILLKLYNFLEVQDEDLKGLLKTLHEQYSDRSVGDWYDLEYNAWCDDYDEEGFQNEASRILEKMLDEVKESMEDEASFDEYNKLFYAVQKLGGFNKFIDMKEKGIEIKFEDLDVNTNKLKMLIYKTDKPAERRSVDNLEDLNLILYHPELFESVRKILKKLL